MDVRPDTGRMEPETLKRQSIDPGQLTAARAVGMTKLQGIRHVVLPQGLRFAIPGLGSRGRE